MENQYRGELPKKGVLGQFVELRRGGGFFCGVIPQCTLS